MVDTISITCYGKTTLWSDRNKAIEYYAIGLASCDPNGSEHDRYAIIMTGLLAGNMNITD